MKEQKEISRKEEKKTSKQIEVLTNSSAEMSLKTDSDLLRTSVASKLIRLPFSIYQKKIYEKEKK